MCFSYEVSSKYRQSDRHIGISYISNIEENNVVVCKHSKSI